MSKRFLYEPQNTTAWEGSIARFSCQVRHAVPPATITWEKDGSPLRSGDRVVILDHGVLQIKNIKKADEGNYRCIASNLARTSYSQAASLTVQRGLYFLTIKWYFVEFNCASEFAISHEWYFLSVSLPFSCVIPILLIFEVFYKGTNPKISNKMELSLTFQWNLSLSQSKQSQDLYLINELFSLFISNTVSFQETK